MASRVIARTLKTWVRTCIWCEEEMVVDTIAIQCSLAAGEFFSCVLVLFLKWCSILKVR